MTAPIGSDEWCDALSRACCPICVRLPDNADHIHDDPEHDRALIRAAVEEARLARDREWSNRIESQDTLHPGSPDLDAALAWYMRLVLPLEKVIEKARQAELERIAGVLRAFAAKNTDVGLDDDGLERIAAAILARKGGERGE
jgi:hypothetical protein